jgi:hypothetical protein
MWQNLTFKFLRKQSANRLIQSILILLYLGLSSLSIDRTPFILCYKVKYLLQIHGFNILNFMISCSNFGAYSRSMGFVTSWFVINIKCECMFEFWCIFKEYRSVGIVMGYRLDGSRGKRFFSSPQNPDKLWGPPSLLSNGYHWFFPQE